MRSVFPSSLMVRLLFQPNAVFKELAELNPSAASVFFKVALWFGILPPVFSYFGTAKFGWHLGTTEPLLL